MKNNDPVIKPLPMFSRWMTTSQHRGERFFFRDSIPGGIDLKHSTEMIRSRCSRVLWSSAKHSQSSSIRIPFQSFLHPFTNGSHHFQVQTTSLITFPISNFPGCPPSAFAERRADGSRNRRRRRISASWFEDSGTTLNSFMNQYGLERDSLGRQSKLFFPRESYDCSL